MIDHAWVTIGLQYLGKRRWPGARRVRLSLRWWRIIRGLWGEVDTSPTSGQFIDAMLAAANLQSPGAGLAQAYFSWGRPLFQPAVGCIVVFERGHGTHVGFLVRVDDPQRFEVLSVYRAGKVEVRPLSPDRVVALRWPSGVRVS